MQPKTCVPEEGWELSFAKTMGCRPMNWLMEFVNRFGELSSVCSMIYFTNFETCRDLWAFQLIGALKEFQESAERSGELARYLPSSADMEADLHDLVETYNDVYSHIYDYTQEKVGEDADGFAER